MFQQLFRMAEFCMAVRSTQLCSDWPCLNTNISQGLASSDTFEGWWDVLLLIYYKVTAKSVGERLLKIAQYLPKLL